MINMRGETGGLRAELAAMAIASQISPHRRGKLELFLLITYIAIANFYIKEYRHRHRSLAKIFNKSRYIAGCGLYNCS